MVPPSPPNPTMRRALGRPRESADRRLTWNSLYRCNLPEERGIRSKKSLDMNRRFTEVQVWNCLKSVVDDIRQVSSHGRSAHERHTKQHGRPVGRPYHVISLDAPGRTRTSGPIIKRHLPAVSLRQAETGGARSVVAPVVALTHYRETPPGLRPRDYFTPLGFVGGGRRNDGRRRGDGAGRSEDQTRPRTVRAGVGGGGVPPCLDGPLPGGACGGSGGSHRRGRLAR